MVATFRAAVLLRGSRWVQAAPHGFKLRAKGVELAERPVDVGEALRHGTVPCHAAHRNRVIDQTAVSQTYVRISLMDHLRLHAPETLLSALDLRALQALAEPNRARIVELLGHGEHCVCDVGGALGLSTALVSHHLRVLREAGLVGERRDGRWVHYALDVERLARLRTAVVALLTPSKSASVACGCSDCSPSATRRASPALVPLEAAGADR